MILLMEAIGIPKYQLPRHLLIHSAQYSIIPIICHSSTSPYTFHSFWYWEAKWPQYLVVEGIFYIFALPKNNLSFTKHFFTQSYIQDPWLEQNLGPNSRSYIDENTPPGNKAIFEAPPLSLIGHYSILVGGNIGGGGVTIKLLFRLQRFSSRVPKLPQTPWYHPLKDSPCQPRPRESTACNWHWGV